MRQVGYCKKMRETILQKQCVFLKRSDKNCFNLVNWYSYATRYSYVKLLHDKLL